MKKPRKKKKIHTEYISIRLSPDLADGINILAEWQKFSKSDAARGLIALGLQQIAIHLKKKRGGPPWITSVGLN